MSPSYPPQNRSRPLCAGRAVLHEGRSGRWSHPWERTAGKESPSQSSSKGRNSSSRDSRKKIRADRSCPTSNGLSYSMNSFPRIACTIGALSLPAISINSACAPAQPAPPRIVIFFD